MRVIYKYPLRVTNEQVIHVGPNSSRPLHVAMQDGKPYVWIEHDDESNSIQDVALGDSRLRVLRVVGTGEVFDRHCLAYIGTVHHAGFVWHVYDGGLA